MFFISSNYRFLMMFLYLQVCFSTDRILTNQSLSGDQTIVSSGGVFELGLFEQGTSNLCYLGIRYWQISTQTIVWVANREFPAPSRDTAYLQISDGNLVLQDGRKKIIWSTRVNSTSGGDVEAFDRTSKGNSLVTVWNGTKSYWSSGAWDHQLGIFEQVTDRNLSFEFDVNGSNYVTYSVSNQNPFRLVMDVSGQLTAYSWVEKQQAWDTKWSAPKQRCKAYGSCGSFGICNEDSDSDSSCECILNISRRSGSVDSSGVCVSKTYLTKCGKGDDKFLPLKNVKLATDPEAWVSTKFLVSHSCDSACLADCSCRAYAYDANRCLMWRSDIFNLQQLHANNSEGKTFYVRLTPDYISPAALNNDNSGDLEDISGRAKHRKVRTIVLAVLLPSVAAAALFISLYCYFSSPQRSRRAQRGKKQSNEAWESWCETKGVSIIDEALDDSYSLKEVMRCVHIALLCVQDHPTDRPTISQIVYMLSNDHDLPIPNQPTFTNVLNCNQRLVPSDYVYSINEATQSTMEGR
ncbi:unnamed protein product [Thlaspi arvense]|uniref:Uncharacterized protein n=1 Tax=Thlaspi arvense TaxID=13288 RepID=A0AAU9RCP7_THLAR|nr:unnamed protein product [Thlaspi arvense]